jgi:hypothetical protein
VEWRLAEYDGEQERLKRRIGGIHEDFFAFDPTGRNGEPRSRPKPKPAAKRRPKRATR